MFDFEESPRTPEERFIDLYELFLSEEEVRIGFSEGSMVDRRFETTVPDEVITVRAILPRAQSDAAYAPYQREIFWERPNPGPASEKQSLLTRFILTLSGKLNVSFELSSEAEMEEFWKTIRSIYQKDENAVAAKENLERQNSARDVNRKMTTHPATAQEVDELLQAVGRIKKT